MKTVVQLLYTGIFSLGVAGGFLTLYRYLKDRSDGTRFYLFAFIVFTLHTATILVSFYFSVADTPAGTQSVISHVNGYLCAISVCFISCTVFLRFRRSIIIRFSRLKRVLYGVLIFLVPQFVFSSSRIGGGSGGGAGADIFWFITLMVAVSTAAILAVRLLKPQMRGRTNVAGVLLAGTAVLIAGQLADLYVKLFGSYSTLSFTVLGYAALSACTIAVVFNHALRASSLSVIGGISRRELEIMDLIIKGYSNRRIAETLFISVSTVKSHTGSIYRKLGINSRMELAAMLAGGPAERDPEKFALL